MNEAPVQKIETRSAGCIPTEDLHCNGYIFFSDLCHNLHDLAEKADYQGVSVSLSLSLSLSPSLSLSLPPSLPPSLFLSHTAMAVVFASPGWRGA